MGPSLHAHEALSPFLQKTTIILQLDIVEAAHLHCPWASQAQVASVMKKNSNTMSTSPEELLTNGRLPSIPTISYEHKRMVRHLMLEASNGWISCQRRPCPRPQRKTPLQTRLGSWRIESCRLVLSRMCRWHLPVIQQAPQHYT